MSRHAWVAAVVALGVCRGAGAEGTEQLLEIIELHEKLAANEAFQQQAKLLGAYMEAAREMPHDQKVLVYRRVLGILHQIDRSSAPAAAPKKPATAEPAAQTSKGALHAGAAHLEWYDAESLDKMPDLPVKRALWTRDLEVVAGETGDLPPAPETSSTARISFFFEAKTAGSYTFAADHGDNDLRILVGGKQLLDLPRGAGRVGQGDVRLEKGYHRIDVLLHCGRPADPTFAVSVLCPGETERRAVTKSDLLLTRPAE